MNRPASESSVPSKYRLLIVKLLPSKTPRYPFIGSQFTDSLHIEDKSILFVRTALIVFSPLLTRAANIDKSDADSIDIISVALTDKRDTPIFSKRILKSITKANNNDIVFFKINTPFRTFGHSKAIVLYPYNSTTHYLCQYTYQTKIRRIVCII